MKKVQKFVCPDVQVPSSMKRNRGDMGWDLSEEDALSRSSNVGRTSRKKDETKAEELSKIFATVKDFSSTRLIGMAKINYNDSKLTKLGVKPPKQKTMPFKMRMGLDSAREKRENIKINKAKQSGIVLPISRKKFESPGSRREKRSDPDVNLHTKGGVLRLDTKRIPAKLLSNR
eukprot:gene3449-6853_t